MRATTIAGVRPLSFDKELAQRIALLTLPVGIGLFSFRAAIEGPEGQVYRILETESLVEVARLHEILRELGLRRSRDRPPRGAAYSALFRLPQAAATGSEAGYSRV